MLANIFIKSDTLHSFVIKEQRAQIIRYLRNSVALKKLEIEIVNQKTGKVYSSGNWKTPSGNATPGGGMNFDRTQRNWFYATYDDPKREPIGSGDNLYWMPHFDEIVAATKGATSGTIQTETSMNTAFGIGISAAKVANIDANWISNQSFVIRAEFA